MLKIIRLGVSAEAKAIFALSLVYLLNILDAMLIMPLIPDMAGDLKIDSSATGKLTAAYSFAAAISGIFFSFFLDYFNRKKALIFSFSGIVIANLLGLTMQEGTTLLFVRLLAGASAGPNFGLVLALVSDIIPAARRGAAMGKVLGAFAVASAVGIPFCLEIAHLYSWRLSLGLMGLAGVIAILTCIAFLPNKTSQVTHVSMKNRIKQITTNFRKPAALNSFAFILVGMIAGFMIIPNLATYLQFNRGFPREYVSMLYLIGGTCSFFTMRFVGILVDRYDAFWVSIFNTVIFIFTLLLGFVFINNSLPLVLVFVMFMMSMSARSVCGQTLSSKVPAESERAAFMSITATMSNLGATIGAFIASVILTQGPNMILIHMDKVALIASCFAFLIPVLIWNTERLLEKRKHSKIECVYVQL